LDDLGRRSLFSLGLAVGILGLISPALMLYFPAWHYWRSRPTEAHRCGRGAWNIRFQSTTSTLISLVSAKK